MYIDNEQNQQLKRHLDKIEVNTGKKVACPICGQTSFNYSGIVEPNFVRQSTMSGGGGPISIPPTFGKAAHVHCATCGYVMLFDIETAKITYKP